MFLGILSLVVTAALAQLSPPARGIQLANVDASETYDIRFPLAITQCEPVLTYYNMSHGGFYLYFLTPDLHQFFSIPMPSGTGYVEWTCNIPTGYGLVAGNYRQHYFVVQPGPESSCLRISEKAPKINRIINFLSRAVIFCWFYAHAVRGPGSAALLCSPPRLRLEWK
jgi:hypothetical protein